MITRRTILQAATAQGLAGTFGAALAQSQSPSRGKATAQKKGSNDRVAVQSDTRIERVLAPVRDTHHLPGLIGAILVGNRLKAIGAVGIRKVGDAQPIRVMDQVHLGSCTKAMTATMIGTLVDEGKLSWGSTFQDVFPVVAPQLDPEFQKVTLFQLLTHRAGLPHDVEWWHLPGQTTTEQRFSLLTTMLVKPPQNRPGSSYVYSNVGYVLAGLMAEEAAGQSWETLMRRRLFEPLGMTSAGFGAPGRPGTVSEPWGHRVSGGQVRPTQLDNAPAMGPAGIVHCSIPDWGKFAALHLAGARGQAKFLKASTFKALQTPPPGFEYAGGWLAVERTWAGGRALNHSGSNTTWFATVWLAPARNLAFLVATNQGGKVAETATDEAVVALIRAVGALG
jgi:CubicO group peptidase (beta-lactamase class C family)